MNVDSEPPPERGPSAAAGRWRRGPLRGRPGAAHVWSALALVLAGKQLMAAAFAWDYGLGKRGLLAQAAFVLLASGALVELIRTLTSRRRLAVLLGVDAFLSTLLLADVLHVQQLGTPVSASMLRYAHQLATIDSALWALLEPKHALLFADLPLLLVSYRAAARREVLGPVSPIRAAAITAIAVAAPLIAGSGAGVRGPGDYSGYTGIAWRYGLVDYHVADLAWAGIAAVRTPSASSSVKRTAIAKAAARRRGAADGALHAVATGANVIVLQVESLQTFAMGMTVGGAPVTPSLDALARESLVARAFFHQTGPGRTSDADLLLNCSVYPAPNGSAYFAFEHNRYYCLPRVLGDAGYRTAAFQATYGDLWNVARMYRRLGYESISALENFELDEPIGVGLSDASLLRQSLARMRRMPEPFFAFVTTLTSHVPYEHGLPLPAAPLPGSMTRAYLQSIRYVDEQIGTFVDGLRAAGLLERSLLVVYGDHDGVPWSAELGAALGWPDDPVSRFLFVRRVPLLVRFPGGRHAGVLDEPMGQIDLAPMIAGAVGVALEGTLFLGREPGSSRPAVLAFPRGEVIDSTRLFVPARGPSEPAACFTIDAHARLPMESCAELANQGAAEISASFDLLQFDLQACARGCPGDRG